MKRGFMPITTWGTDLITTAKSIVAMALINDATVYWRHEDKIAMLVRPGMTCDEVIHALTDGQEFVKVIFVRWIDDEEEDVTLRMNEIDKVFRELSLGRFVLCCDIEKDTCSTCLEEERPLPIQFPDGTFAIGLDSTTNRKVAAVQRALSKYNRVEVVN